jgi:hypothetical protein
MKKIKERYSMKEEGEIFSEEELNKEIMEFFGLNESALTDLIKGSITGQEIRAAAKNVKQTFTGVGDIDYNNSYWRFAPITNGLKSKKNEKLNLFERIVMSPLEAVIRVITIPLTLTIDSVLCIILGTKALMQKKDKAGKVSSKDLENMKKQIEEIEKRAKTDNKVKNVIPVTKHSIKISPIFLNFVPNISILFCANSKFLFLSLAISTKSVKLEEQKNAMNIISAIKQPMTV